MPSSKKAMAAGLLVLGLGGWMYWTGTPQYSVRQIAKSVESRDRKTFEKYVYLGGVTMDAVDDLTGTLLDMVVEEEIGEARGMTALGVGVAAGFIEVMKPAATAYLNRSIVRGVESGEMREAFATSDGSAERGEGQVFRESVGSLVHRAELRGLGSFEVDGPAATAPLRVRYADLDTTLVLTLEMRRSGRRWRLTRIGGVGEMLRSVREIEEIQLAELNASSGAEIASLLETGAPVGRLQASDRLFGLAQDLWVEVPVRNRGDAPLRSIRVSVRGADGDGETVLGSSGELGPGETATLRVRIDYNPFVGFHRRLGGNAAGISARVERLEVKDGGRWREVGTYESWADYLESREESA